MGWCEVCIIGLLGGIVALDMTAAWQSMLSQPIVACSIAGILFHDLTTGVLVGIVMECLWLNQTPLGGVLYAEGRLASAITGITAVQLGYEPYHPLWYYMLFIILVYGILLSIIGGKIVIWNRRNNLLIINHALQNLQKGSIQSILRGHRLCLLNTFLVGGIITILFSLTGTFVTGIIISHTPDYFIETLGHVTYGILGIGLGMLIVLLWHRNRFPALIAGIGMMLLYYIVQYGL